MCCLDEDELCVKHIHYVFILVKMIHSSSGLGIGDTLIRWPLTFVLLLSQRCWLRYQGLTSIWALGKNHTDLNIQIISVVKYELLFFKRASEPGTFTLPAISSRSLKAWKPWAGGGHLHFRVWTWSRARVTPARQRPQLWRHSEYLEVQLSRTVFSFCANFSAVMALRSLLQKK